MTHIVRIRGVFDVANSQRYRAGFAPMLFQRSHAHIARFFVAKNRAIKKSRYVCHGTYTILMIVSKCYLKQTEIPYQHSDIQYYMHNEKCDTVMSKTLIFFNCNKFDIHQWNLELPRLVATNFATVDITHIIRQ